MRTKSKRLSALFLAFAMSVSVMQATAFAAEAHNGTVAARNVTIEADGSFTIYKRCDTHKNQPGSDCQETVTGKIATKVVDGQTTHDTTNDQLPAGVTVDIETMPVTCAEDGTIIYKVTVDGTDFTSNKFTTAKATGKHEFETVAANATADDLRDATITGDTSNTKAFKEVSDTSTCQAAGKVTFAKVCTVCKKTIESETVTVDGTLTDHHFVQEKNATTGKDEDKVFEQVITAATCADKGSAYHYIQCKDCDQKLYKDTNDTYTATTLKGAAKVDLEKLAHNYTYTIAWPENVTDDTDLAKKAPEVKGTCSACTDQADGHTVGAQDVTVTLDKTVAPAAACVYGSKTYTVTYKAANTDTVNKDKTFTETKTIPYSPNGKAEHKWSTPAPDEDSVVEATCVADGKYNLVKTCSVCGEKEVVATVKLPMTGDHIAAAAKKESVVKATYAKAGSYKLVTRCAECGKVLKSEKKTIAKLKVNAPKLSSVKNYKGKKMKASWKKASSVSGYQLQYAKNKSFKSAKSVKTKSTSKTVSKLSKKKKYYVRVRSYKVSGGKTYYSSWSNVKTVTIKK